MKAATANNTQQRALDVHDMVSMVTSAFYAEFDWTDDTYYWVVSVMIDNTLVAEDGSTSKLHKVGFQIKEANEISFQPKDEWVEVQKEYVPVRSIEITQAERQQKWQEAMNRGIAAPNTRDQSDSTTDVSFDEDTRSYSGYGIVFDSDSEPLVLRINGRNIQVVEQISRASVAEANMSEVIAAYDHNFSQVLARTEADTLKLEVDNTGVQYRFEVPDTSYGNDLLVNTRLGNIRGSSFTFTIDQDAGYDIQERSDGVLLAIPNKITRVMEIGPVVNPAYPGTTAENRSAALVRAVEAHFRQKEEENAIVSDEQMAHLEAQLRHNEEAAK